MTKQAQLSVVIPAQNERDSIHDTLEGLYATLRAEEIPHEILVVDDCSTDGTADRVMELRALIPSLRCLLNHSPRGFGYAVRRGLEEFSGDCVAIMMADGSDSAADLVRFYRTMCEQDLDAVFGSRFSDNGHVIDYPFPKLVLNRFANKVIKVLFRLKYDDVTNAFKLYRRSTIEGLQPLLAPHFNLTMELPLKTIVRGYSYTWLGNTWKNRANGVSKGTADRVMELRALIPSLRCLLNHSPRGFGYAVRRGLEEFSGDCVAIMMADGSDSAADLVRFYRTMCEQDLDAVFGSRFSDNGHVIDYPFPKLVLNRFANKVIKVLFRLKYDDVTNAFKLYRRSTIEGLQPLLAPHFNLTMELPLKTIVRGYSYTWLGNTWKNRANGVSKFKIKEMGSRYLFIMFYCLIEKYFSRGDYRKPD